MRDEPQARQRFSGVVRPGQARGRSLGFPTANLQVGGAAQLPQGVWAGLARWEAQQWRGALINIGTRPTFAQAGLSVEVHVLDFSGDLYGKTLEVELLQRLRGEQRFAAAQQLIEQIRRDIKDARALFKSTFTTDTEV